MTEPSDTMQATTEGAPATPATPDAAPAPAAAPAKGRGRLLMVVLTVVVLVAVAVTAWMKYRQITTSPDKAKVNDCLSGTTAGSIELVGCSDSAAKWRVVGKVTVTNAPSEDEQRLLCVRWPDTEQIYAKPKDYVLCLANK